ncbi:MAG: hypothetical protein LBF67_04160 [Prevotellaceae bacterium]|jgi:predicted RNA-binding Zn-ribbon protein involved in translation (DUF1610 family)|nr:hypothetical protein [Prevotellaceae bacterium]
MNIQQQQPSGFQCPACGGFIPISIQQLLTTEHFTCPQCAIEFRLNKASSHKALNALRKVHEAEVAVKQAAVFDGNKKLKTKN